MADDTLKAVQADIKDLNETIEGHNEDVKERFQKISEWEEDIKSLKEASLGSADVKEKVVKAAEEVAEITDKITKAQKELNERQDEFETELEDKIGKGFAGRKTLDLDKKLSEALDESDMTSSKPGRAYISFKSWDQVNSGMATKDVTDVAGSGGPLLVAQTRPGIIGPATRDLRIRDLVPVLQTSSSSIDFMQEDSHTDNAQTQAAQGDVKGESDFVFSKENEPVITIAHFVQVSTQMLDDVAALRSYIEMRMRFLLDLEEEDQILNGSGTNELNGIKTQATAYDTSLTTSTDPAGRQKVDIIRAAILQSALAHYQPSGVVVHPADWFDMETLKDTNEQYLFARAQDSAVPRLWGLPVVSTTAQTQTEFTVGAFRLGAALYDRQQAAVQLSTEDSDNFQRNLVTIRAERREALTVIRPESFIDGDFDTAIT